MIDEIITLLNHQQPKVCEWYFRTLIEKFTFISPALSLQIQCDTALGIMKGMVLSITEEKENEGPLLQEDADYIIKQIQLLAENLFDIRFNLPTIIHPWILRQFCAMHLKGTIPSRDFDYAMLNSFNIARNCVRLIDVHVNHLQEIYNEYRGKPVDTTILYRKRELERIRFQLEQIYNNPQINLIIKLEVMYDLFTKYAEKDNTRSSFKQFCHDKAQEIAFLHGELVQDIASNPHIEIIFDAEAAHASETSESKRERIRRRFTSK